RDPGVLEIPPPLLDLLPLGRGAEPCLALERVREAGVVAVLDVVAGGGPGDREGEDDDARAAGYREEAAAAARQREANRPPDEQSGEQERARELVELVAVLGEGAETGLALGRDPLDLRLGEDRRLERHLDDGADEESGDQRAEDEPAAPL